MIYFHDMRFTFGPLLDGVVYKQIMNARKDARRTMNTLKAPKEKERATCRLPALLHTEQCQHNAD
jgi:hypothetical protein